ncbi:condensation domain-containing protein [Acetivibrio straminisolvens]|uniref:Long-chain-fatty-acid-CoA ligase n=1 Tax=Acetivibrio straminisolvens JCM 21531 TaxID=1294263 RepID=W4UZP5_9FIRM|nr:condensation domain-containing protein [Acetivibrio straminisolvens]GAE86740.1 long-chain-fatty-acid-CoA ligase [Acetivibrio straminisolvens JCM 21531]
MIEKKNAVLLEKRPEEAKKYWLEKLSSEMSCASLPVDFARTDKYKRAECKINFDKKSLDKLLEVYGDNELDLYTFLLTVYKVLLFKYTGQEDITVASPVIGENCKANRIIPLRDFIEDEITFDQLLGRVANTVNEAYENQCYPISDVVICWA